MQAIARETGPRRKLLRILASLTGSRFAQILSQRIMSGVSFRLGQIDFSETTYYQHS